MTSDKFVEVVKFIWQFVKFNFVVTKKTLLKFSNSDKRTDGGKHWHLSTAGDMAIITTPNVFGKTLIYVFKWTKRVRFFKVIDWGKIDKGVYTVRVGDIVIEFRTYGHHSWFKFDKIKFEYSESVWYDIGKLTIIFQDADKWLQAEMEKQYDW